MFLIHCEDADHLSRINEPGWADSLGESSIENAPGYLCPACAAARALQQSEEESE